MAVAPDDFKSSADLGPEVRISSALEMPLNREGCVSLTSSLMLIEAGGMYYRGNNKWTSWSRLSVHDVMTALFAPVINAGLLGAGDHGI